NLKTKTINGINTTYNYNDNDQLIAQDTQIFTYDDNGNLIQKDDTTYSYDAKNRLIKVTTPTETVEYNYDANDNRIAKTTTNGTTTYLVDTNTPYAQVITESKENGTKIGYTCGNDLLHNGSHFYLTDALGSTRGLVDGGEKLTDSYSYTPYGELSDHNGTSENSFLYTGEQLDPETENYYLRARYYSPSSSRFLSRDSYDGTLGDPITQNHYAYGNSNPSMFVDPSGHIGIMEVQLSMSIQSELKGMQTILMRQMMKSIASELGCDIAITFVKDALTEGAGIYLFRAIDGLPYVGRTNNFVRRLKEHLRGKLISMNQLLGRIKFHNMVKPFSQSELNAIEELIMRSIDDMTGGNLSGMSNARRNYGDNSDAYDKLMKKIKQKCRGK
ncbi:MAG: hypothetical protein KU38_10485, partial [Sulfurovum sp. FS08-3]